MAGKLAAKNAYRSRSADLVRSIVFHHRVSIATIVISSMIAGAFEALTFAFIAACVQLVSGHPLGPGFSEIPLIGPLVGRVIAASTPGELVVMSIAGIITCQILRAGFAVACAVKSTALAVDVQRETQRLVFERVLSLSYPCTATFKTGELSNLVQAPSLHVASIIDYGGRAVVFLVMIIFYIGVLAFISVPLFGIALVVFGLIAYAQRRISRQVRELARSISNANSELAREIVETVQTLRIVHTFGLWDIQRRKMAKSQEVIAEGTRTLVRRMSLLAPISDTAVVVAIGVFLCVGYFLLRSDDSAMIANLVAFVAALNRMAGRVTNLSFALAQVNQRLGSLAIVDPLLDDEGKTFLASGDRPLPIAPQEVVFEDVGLTYPGRDGAAIQGVNLRLSPGRSVALVGPSGAGKSTIADILLRLYPPTTGRILVDGVDLRELVLGDWLQHVAVVSQDTTLFNDTLAENIRRGRPEATDADVDAAALAAGVTEFARLLPAGLATMVGERGFALSGGQRQRVAVARAILRKAAILILDEATSALDSETEQVVQRAIQINKEHHALLVIAHRLSTIRDADEIVVVDHGRIVETGTHDDLLKKKGRYAALVRAQSSDEDPKPPPAAALSA